MAQLKLTQIKSVINRSERQKKTIAALGLGRPNYITLKPDNPQVRGMVHVVAHLLKVEEISE